MHIADPLHTSRSYPSSRKHLRTMQSVQNLIMQYRIQARRQFARRRSEIQIVTDRSLPMLRMQSHRHVLKQDCESSASVLKYFRLPAEVEEEPGDSSRPIHMH